MIVFRLIVNVFFPLVIGSFIYLLLRCNNVYFIDIAENMFFMNLDQIAGYTCQKVITSEWITNNLPDGLWVYSLTSLMIIIWQNYTLTSLVWICSGLLIAILSEFCQAIGLLSGTYDQIDIVFYLLAFGLANFNLSSIPLKTMLRNRL